MGTLHSNPFRSIWLDISPVLFLHCMNSQKHSIVSPRGVNHHHHHHFYTILSLYIDDCYDFSLIGITFPESHQYILPTSGTFSLFLFQSSHANRNETTWMIKAKLKQVNKSKHVDLSFFSLYFCICIGQGWGRRLGRGRKKIEFVSKWYELYFELKRKYGTIFRLKWCNLHKISKDELKNSSVRVINLLKSNRADGTNDNIL